MYSVDHLPMILDGRCVWRTVVYEQLPGKAFNRFHHDGPRRLPVDEAIGLARAAWQAQDAPLADIEQALADWRGERAYVDGRGNYHVKAPGRSSGPIAPWNRAAKRAFPTVTDLHNAAKITV